MDFLEIDKLSAFYGKAEALHEVSLSVKQGEIIAMLARMVLENLLFLIA